VEHKVKSDKFDVKRLKTITIVFISIASLLFFSILLYQSAPLTGNETVLTVNGEPVCHAEFSLIMSGLRANVFSYFSQKYGVEGDTDFWTSRYGSEVPEELLRESTISKLKRIKVEQILMKQHGLILDVSYAEFLRDLETENDRRRKALSKNLPIYGPKQYEERVYYDYLHSVRTEKLKQILSKQELLVSETEAQRFYEDNKKLRYKKTDQSYEEVRSQIERALLNAKYDAMIENLAIQADVEFR